MNKAQRDGEMELERTALRFLDEIRAAVWGPGQGPMHGEFAKELAKLERFRAKVARLTLYAVEGEEPRTDGEEPFLPGDPGDAEEALNGLIIEARLLKVW